MTAILTVALGLFLGLAGLVLLLRRGWRAMVGLILLICGPIAAVATLPQAWVALAGQSVPGVVAELEERATAHQRRGWWGERRSFRVGVCYRLPERPGLGVEVPFADLLGQDRVPSPCATLAGDGPERIARVRYSEAAFDRLRPGMPVLVQVARIGDVLEVAYAADAPVLPWLPRPWSAPASGSVVTARAEVVEVTRQDRGVMRGGASGSFLAVPLAHVRLRFTPPGAATPVEVIDRVDADWRPDLAQGAMLDVTFDAALPREAMIVNAGRSHQWRNLLHYVVLFSLPSLLLAAAFWWWRRRRA